VPEFLLVVSNVIGKHCPLFVFLVFFAWCTRQSGKFTRPKTGSGNEFLQLCCDVSLHLHYFGAQDNVKLSIRQVETSLLHEVRLFDTYLCPPGGERTSLSPETCKSLAYLKEARCVPVPRSLSDRRHTEARWGVWKHFSCKKMSRWWEVGHLPNVAVQNVWK